FGIALRFIFDMSMDVTGKLGVFMAVVSVFRNMIFNHYFEKLEHKKNWERTNPVRFLHAIGFEGAFLIATV
ncbi:chlorhexidine efflux PACE transporter AceI, partial [Acinetobacter calcoaceticus]